MLSRSSIAVVLVAAATGVVLARAAAAVGSEAAPRVTVPVVSAAVAASSGASAPASSLGPSAASGTPAALPAPVTTTHDENEPDDSHGPGSDNPYDDTPAPRTGVTRVTVLAQDGMLKLPAGKFVMGSSNPRAPANERPSRAVTLNEFWIDRTEVTVGAYHACVEAHACVHPARASATCTYDAGDPDLPVSCVHWNDAEAYCHFAGKRLPTEFEWEYAARGPMAVPFPWGGAASCTNAITLINDQSAKSCAPHPAHVGSHPSGASLFGVQDMSGNVEEWTADWYAETLAPGPAPRAGSAHVLRGGGWLSPPSLSRTTARDWGSAVEAGPNVGFRCARDD
jgi:sulfatase modifying factor 1